MFYMVFGLALGYLLNDIKNIVLDFVAGQVLKNNDIDYIDF